MRILMITAHLPFPPISGYPLRIYNLIQRISREHEVWLATFVRDSQETNELQHMLKFCKEIVTVEWQETRATERPFEAFRYLLSGKPPDLRFYYSKELMHKIIHLVSKVDFNVIDIEDSSMGLYLESLPAELHARTVLTFHDIVFNKLDRISRLEPKPTRKMRLWLNGQMMRRWEPYYTERFGRCITVSESDRRLLLSVNPHLQIDVAPNGVDTKLYQPLSPSNLSPALIFVGNMGYRPNIDAMTHFLQAIYPRIRKEVPSLEMWIVGINPSSEVKQLAGDGVHVTGSVDDLLPFYRRSTVCVVPLRAGGGTRLKILEAMAVGRPVVSTSIGCEGLDVTDGDHLFIADRDEQFAEKTLQLLADRDLCKRITASAWELTKSKYDWDVITKKLLQTYSDVDNLVLKPHLMWIIPFSLIPALDSATWLDTTAELRNSGWRVTLVTAGLPGKQSVKGVEVLCIPKPETYVLGQFIFHIRIITLLLHHRDTVDIILFHEMSAPWLLPMGVLRKLTGKKRPLFIMDTRSLDMNLRSKSSWKDRIRGIYYKIVEKLANRWADGRLAITQRMAQAVKIPQAKLWGVWPSGVNQDQFFPAQAARKWPLPEEAIHLIYIGVLNYERNLMSLCWAVEKGNSEGMHFILSLVGEGTEQADLAAFAKFTNGRIRVLPPVPHPQVPAVLAQAHVGVLPFPDEEKFRVSSPIKLFEYMAAGLPILATRITCHTDVVGDGKFAFWADHSDGPGLLSALQLIWQNSDRLSDMGQEAAVAARNWTWRESAMKLKNALEYGLEKYAGAATIR